MFFYIKVFSITNAQRGKSLLKKLNIKSEISRLDEIEKGDGCGYVLKISDEYDEKEILKILKNNGIKASGGI